MLTCIENQSLLMIELYAPHSKYKSLFLVCRQALDLHQLHQLQFHCP